MYLMAALPSYCKSGNRGAECTASSSGGGSGSICAGSADFNLLAIDENDNSFPWGLIHHNELAHMLNGGLGKTMVIDSRSFLEYNTSTIQQSVNVCCSKLVKRRLQQDKVHVLDLLNQTCNIGADASWDVIVYDQCTEDPSQLTCDNFVAVLLHKLSTTFNSVAFLKGGFLAFQASHPSLTENKSSSHRCSTLTSLSQPCMPVSNVGPTRILPFLYLGSQQDSLNQELAQVNGITYILNVSKTCPRPPFILEGHFHRIPVNDNYCEKLLPFFQEAFQFLDKVREANGCVLVHCLGGVSRSATLAIAYIMRYYRMSSDEAYRYVKDKRPTISPNFNFLGQLLEYEKVLRQEEQHEVVRRKILRDEEGELDRASPAMMDLHTTSPSSPGPRTAQRLFTMDISPPHLQALMTSSVTASSRRFMMSEQLMQEGSFIVPELDEDSHNYRKLKMAELRHFPGSSIQACPFPGPSLESSPMPGLSSKLCPMPGLSSELCPMPEQSNQNQPDSQSACFSAVYLNHKADTTLTSAHTGHDFCPTQQAVTFHCDNARQNIQPATAHSPVCPITGFPSPASAVGDFPESTCHKTGFPGPGHYGSSSSIATRQTRVMTPDSSDLSHVTVMTETETLFKNCTTYHSLTDDSGSSAALTSDSSVSSIQSDGFDSGHNICSKSSRKEQTRSKAGFSLSSMLSSLRWKSRPPTLSLGSPVGTMKDVNRHSKKHTAESSGVGDSRIQLTPVSEAVENCDLMTCDIASDGLNESLTVNSSWQSDCAGGEEKNGLDFVIHVSSSGSSLSNATTIAMASIQSNLSLASRPSMIMSSHSNSVVVTSTSCAPSSLVKPTRLSISAKKFTLPLSSPNSDFPTVISSSSHSLQSPGDSNKRKSFPSSSSDSPDKLAKTDSSHLHTLSPPKTLSLAQGLAGKMRPKFFSKRPFVLPVSSPTSATMEDMARLKVTSPSDPPHEAAKQVGLTASHDDQKDCYSSLLDLEIKTKCDLSLKVKELPPRMFFKSSDPRSVSSIKAGLPYGYTKWKSATSLCAADTSLTKNTLLGEMATLSKLAGSQQQHTDTSLLCSLVGSSSSMPRSSSLSKSCTSIYSPSGTSSSVRKMSSFISSCSVNLQGFSQFPTTSLDKLSFTPCYTKDIVQELKRQESEQLASLERGISPSDGNLGPSVLDSPMSISSGSSAPSIASSTLSPVESNMVNVFSDSRFHTAHHNSTAFAFAQSDNTAMPNFGSPQGSPSSVFSPTSTSDFILSPSSMPQATVAPTTPTFNSLSYCCSLSMEPLSPMSLSDSNSSSPLRSPTRNGITSPVPSSISTPASSLSSPVISSPPFSPHIVSPVCSSSHMAGTSTAPSLSSRVVLRRDKSKRVMDRPNSIAFSTYPTCDLVPVTSGSQESQNQASLDDSSEAYMIGRSKRSRCSKHPGSHILQGRTSWGGYSEREMYRQITAAMENAMLRTQVFSSSSSGRRLTSSQASSRKARSLDDIVDSNVDEDDFMPGPAGGGPWTMCAEQCAIEQYRCSMQNVSEPYHSSSSLSSNGSHNGSMEIQVS